MADRRADLEAALRILEEVGASETEEANTIRALIAADEAEQELIRAVAYTIAPMVYDAYRLGVWKDKDELLSWHELDEDKQKPQSEAWYAAKVLVDFCAELTELAEAEKADELAASKTKEIKK